MSAHHFDIGLRVPTCRQRSDVLRVSFFERLGDQLFREGLNKNILNHYAVRCGKENLHICDKADP